MKARAKSILICNVDRSAIGQFTIVRHPAQLPAYPTSLSGAKQRIPQMAGYDVFSEMNLTRNRFRRFFKSADAGSIEYEEEPLDALLKRTCSGLVHDLDKDCFREFWDTQP